MAFKKINMFEIFRKTILVLFAVPMLVSSNIDCNGKSFHCVNSTHFRICVDLGSGVSSTIDDFIIECPSPTECKVTNYFECEFPVMTTVAPTIVTSAPSVFGPSEISGLWEISSVSTSAAVSAIDQTTTEANTVSAITLEGQVITTDNNNAAPVTDGGTKHFETMTELLLENTFNELLTTTGQNLNTKSLTENSLFDYTAFTTVGTDITLTINSTEFTTFDTTIASSTVEPVFENRINSTQLNESINNANTNAVDVSNATENITGQTVVTPVVQTMTTSNVLDISVSKQNEYFTPTTVTEMSPPTITDSYPILQEDVTQKPSIVLSTKMGADTTTQNIITAATTETSAATVTNNYNTERDFNITSAPGVSETTTMENVYTAQGLIHTAPIETTLTTTLANYNTERDFSIPSTAGVSETTTMENVYTTPGLSHTGPIDTTLTITVDNYNAERDLVTMTLVDTFTIKTTGKSYSTQAGGTSPKIVSPVPVTDNYNTEPNFGQIVSADISTITLEDGTQNPPTTITDNLNTGSDVNQISSIDIIATTTASVDKSTITPVDVTQNPPTIITDNWNAGRDVNHISSIDMITTTTASVDKSTITPEDVTQNPPTMISNNWNAGRDVNHISSIDMIATTTASVDKSTITPEDVTQNPLTMISNNWNAGRDVNHISSIDMIATTTASVDKSTINPEDVTQNPFTMISNNLNTDSGLNQISSIDMITTTTPDSLHVTQSPEMKNSETIITYNQNTENAFNEISTVDMFTTIITADLYETQSTPTEISGTIITENYNTGNYIDPIPVEISTATIDVKYSTTSYVTQEPPQGISTATVIDNQNAIPDLIVNTEKIPKKDLKSEMPGSIFINNFNYAEQTIPEAPSIDMSTTIYTGFTTTKDLLMNTSTDIITNNNSIRQEVVGIAKELLKNDINKNENVPNPVSITEKYSTTEQTSNIPEFGMKENKTEKIFGPLYPEISSSQMVAKHENVIDNIEKIAIDLQTTANTSNTGSTNITEIENNIISSNLETTTLNNLSTIINGTEINNPNEFNLTETTIESKLTTNNKDAPDTTRSFTETTNNKDLWIIANEPTPQTNYNEGPLTPLKENILNHFEKTPIDRQTIKTYESIQGEYDQLLKATTDGEAGLSEIAQIITDISGTNVILSKRNYGTQTQTTMFPLEIIPEHSVSFSRGKETSNGSIQQDQVESKKEIDGASIREKASFVVNKNMIISPSEKITEPAIFKTSTSESISVIPSQQMSKPNYGSEISSNAPRTMNEKTSVKSISNSFKIFLNASQAISESSTTMQHSTASPESIIGGAAFVNTQITSFSDSVQVVASEQQTGSKGQHLHDIERPSYTSSASVNIEITDTYTSTPSDINKLSTIQPTSDTRNGNVPLITETIITKAPDKNEKAISGGLLINEPTISNKEYEETSKTVLISHFGDPHLATNRGVDVTKSTLIDVINDSSIIFNTNVNKIEPTAQTITTNGLKSQDNMFYLAALPREALIKENNKIASNMFNNNTKIRLNTQKPNSSTINPENGLPVLAYFDNFNNATREISMFRKDFDVLNQTLPVLQENTYNKTVKDDASRNDSVFVSVFESDTKIYIYGDNHRKVVDSPPSPSTVHIVETNSTFNTSTAQSLHTNIIPALTGIGMATEQSEKAQNVSYEHLIMNIMNRNQDNISSFLEPKRISTYPEKNATEFTTHERSFGERSVPTPFHSNDKTDFIIDKVGRIENKTETYHNTGLNFNKSTLLDYQKYKEDLTTNKTSSLKTSQVTLGLKLNHKNSYNDTSEKISKSYKVDHLFHFCQNRSRGRYSDHDDCAIFYICIGKNEPIVGKCPANTVFSDLKKQCTKNKSHCVRRNEFKCISEGRFSDILSNNLYYICVKRNDSFTRYQFQCQIGYSLNKTSVKCVEEEVLQQSILIDINSDSRISKESKSKQYTNHKSVKKLEETDTESKSSKEKDTESETSKENNKETKDRKHFECSKEGKFVDPKNCKKYYLCTKHKKSEFRRRRKSCDSDEVFHKDKKKCVDADSYEC